MRKVLFLYIYILLHATSLFSNETMVLTLNDAINYALKHNHENKISKLALEISNAQYNQAKSANYPILELNTTALRKDESANFKMNADINLPNELISPLKVLNSNMPSSIPFDTNVEIAGRDSVFSSLKLTYPIYTGGKISSIIKQASINKKIKNSDIKLKDNEIILNVKKIYFAYILSKSISIAMDDSLRRMQMVKQLTKKLYENQSLNVKKTDYLKTKITVSMLKAKFDEIESNKELMKSALKNILAVPYNTKIVISENRLSDFSSLDKSFEYEKLYSQAKQTNAFIKKLNFAIDASKEKIEESKSAYLPTVALFAQSSKFYNNKDGGLNTNENSNGWSIGINASINIFNGFKNENEILEQRLKTKELQSRDLLLKDAIAYQLKEAYLGYQKSFLNINTYKEANLDAMENRVLNIKAYKSDLVETKEVIEAQIVETKTKIMYFNSFYDYLFNIAKMSNIVGRDL